MKSVVTAAMDSLRHFGTPLSDRQPAEQQTVSGPSSQTGLGTVSNSLPATGNLPIREQFPALSSPFLSCARRPSRYTAAQQCSENVVIFPRNMHDMRNMQV
jgi:hypothetical protein